MAIGGRDGAQTDATSAAIMELESYFQSQLKKYVKTDRSFHAVLSCPRIFVSAVSHNDVMPISYMHRAQCYEAYIQESYKTCRTCVAQHQVGSCLRTACGVYHCSQYCEGHV